MCCLARHLASVCSEDVCCNSSLRDRLIVSQVTFPSPPAVHLIICSLDLCSFIASIIPKSMCRPGCTSVSCCRDEATDSSSVQMCIASPRPVKFPPSWQQQCFALIFIDLGGKWSHFQWLRSRCQSYRVAVIQQTHGVSKIDWYKPKFIRANFVSHCFSLSKGIEFKS